MGMTDYMPGIQKLQNLKVLKEYYEHCQEEEPALKEQQVAKCETLWASK